MSSRVESMVIEAGDGDVAGDAGAFADVTCAGCGWTQTAANELCASCGKPLPGEAPGSAAADDEGRPADVACVECGNVQADMGRGVACEGCGAPMPAPEGGDMRVFLNGEEVGMLSDAMLEKLGELIGAEFADPLAAAAANGEAVSAQPALEGTGVDPLVTVAGDLWDPVDGYRIREIALGVSGGLGLFAGSEFHRSLAEKLTRNGSEFALTLRGTVEQSGHKVARYKGAMVGLTGVAKFKVGSVVDVDEYYEELGELRDRFDDGMAALSELIDEVREQGRGSTTDPRIQARALIRALNGVVATFAGASEASFIDPDGAARPPRPRFIDLIREAEAEPEVDAGVTCACGHLRSLHAGADIDGVCDAEREILMGDGELRREGCSCAEFRPAGGEIADECANCDHGEHADGSPGCVVEVRRQQFTLAGELADIWGPCACRFWLPKVTEAGPVEEGPSNANEGDEPDAEPEPEAAEGVEPSVLERELAGSVGIALARASGRPALGAVAPEGERCGLMHAGHLSPCPYDAFECSLPVVGEVLET